MEHFPDHKACLDYALAEIVDTLLDDLERMEGIEANHYTDEERKEMRGRIADINSIIPHVGFVEVKA